MHLSRILSVLRGKQEQWLAALAAQGVGMGGGCAPSRMERGSLSIHDIVTSHSSSLSSTSGHLITRPQENNNYVCAQGPK